MVRAGLRELLKEDRHIAEIGEAGNGAEALERLKSSAWDLVLLDINIPDRNGMDLLREIRGSWPETKVLVLSVCPAHQYALSVLKAGGSGYLAKECAPSDLLDAVRTVLQGRRYVTPQLSEMLLDFDPNDQEPLHTRLSERELNVFSRLAVGYAVSEIAKEFGLSIKTVSTYRTRILEKMKLKTNADLTVYAVRNAIIQ
jgi:DNA-binding NarL/FixJ family response regulator